MYFQVIYALMPILGTIRILRYSGILLVVSYIVLRDRFGNETALKHPLFKAWIGFLVVLMLGILWSHDRAYTQRYVIVCIKYFIIFVISIKIIDSRKRLDFIMGLFALCAVGMASFAVYNYVTGGLIREYRAIAVEGGIFSDPNDLNLLLNAALPFAVYSFISAGKKVFWLAGIIVIASAVMLSFSRGGFLGLCAVAGGFALLFGKRNRKVWGAVLVGFIIFFLSAPEAYLERLSTIMFWQTTEGVPQKTTRLDTWIAMIKGGVYSPVFGVGAGGTYYIAGELLNDWHLLHNSFLQVLIETGIVGFYFYLKLYLIPIRQYKQYISLMRDEDIIRWKVTLISFLGCGMTSLFLPQAYSPVLFLITSFIIIQYELIRLYIFERTHGESAAKI